MTEATEAAEATDAASLLNTDGGIYADISDWAEMCRKYAGKVEVILTLIYKTVLCAICAPEFCKLDNVVGSKASCHVSHDVGMVAVDCAMVYGPLSQ